MKTIAHSFDLNEVLRLQMALEAAGIPSFVPDETMASLAPHHFLTSSGIRLQVADGQFVEAQHIIAQERQSS